MKVLIAEDDMLIRDGLIEILEDEGYQVFEAEDGQEAIGIYHDSKPDFICLDIMMPQKNGYEVCREIRKTNNEIPIVFLSAKSQEEDKIEGFNLGADDYITKPFGVEEVKARIRAVTRRCIKQDNDESFTMKHIEVNSKSLSISKNGEEIEVSLKDIKILQFLNKNKNAAVSRQQLCTSCWEMEFTGNTRSIDQKISQLRKLIELDPSSPQIIQTAHGVGYIFKD